MEIKINHRDFIKNKLGLNFSTMRLQILYNGEPVKTKWGKAYLKDDNNRERVVKIVDFLFTTPYITIDKIEKISILPNVPKYMFLFIVPSILMFRGGIIGYVLGALSIYVIRNICLSDKTTGQKCVMNIIAIVVFYLLFYVLLMSVFILAKKNGYI